MNFVERKKRNFHFQIMGSSDKGKQKYFIFGPTMLAIPFHEYSISQNFWGFMLPDNTDHCLSFYFTTMSMDCEL